MTEVKVIKAVGGHAKGDTINITESAAEFLINAGRVERIEAAAKPTRKAPAKAGAKGDSEQVGGDSPKQSAQPAG